MIFDIAMLYDINRRKDKVIKVDFLKKVIKVESTNKKLINPLIVAVKCCKCKDSMFLH